MGLWIHSRIQLLLETPSESERHLLSTPSPLSCPPVPTVLPNDQTQPKPANLGGSLWGQPPANSPDWRRRRNMKVNESLANKDTHLPPVGRQQIPPITAEPPVQLANLMDDMQGESQHPASPEADPLSGGWGSPRPCPAGLPGSSKRLGTREPHVQGNSGLLPLPCCQELLLGPQGGARTGSAHLRAPPAFAAPELFLYLISLHYGNLHTSAEHISVQNTNQEQ